MTVYIHICERAGKELPESVMLENLKESTTTISTTTISTTTISMMVLAGSNIQSHYSVILVVETLNH